jgi:hypothetical protein
MRYLSLAVAIIAACVVPLGAAGHHSVAVYSSDAIELEGEITAIAWANPHVILELRTTGSDGKIATWKMEGGSVTTLQRSGVTQELLQVGDHVKVVGRASRREPFIMGVMNVLLPDGRELILLTGAPQRFANSDLVRGSARTVVDAQRENRGIFRVWTVPNPNPVTPALQRLPFTAAAVDARRSFDLLDNFATRCEPEGMPRIMFNPHPFEFIDRGGTIAIRSELYDSERTIHMDVATPPAGTAPSRLGYSVGRWDGKDLVVTTTHVNWPFFDNIGSPQSEAVEIVERFTLSDDQAQLVFQTTVNDATTFTAPAVIDGRWLALGETIAPYNCQPAQR